MYVNVHGRNGLGFLSSALPKCSALTIPAGWVGPVDCDPSEGGVQTSGPSTDQFSQLSLKVQELEAREGDTLASWVTRNGTMLAIAGAAVFGLMLLKGRR